MSWLDYFLRRRINTELVEAAQAIAVRHRIAVWERVEDTVPQMSPSEARGYIRARAATIVHSEADKVIAGHDLLTDAQLPLLVAAAPHPQRLPGQRSISALPLKSIDAGCCAAPRKLKSLVSAVIETRFVCVLVPVGVEDETGC